MGKVTLYYLLHAGRGALDSPRFRKAFKQADVVDLELRYSPHFMKKDIAALARGDREAYGRVMHLYKTTYADSKSPTIQHLMELMEMLFKSGKKVDFERKLKAGERSKYRARMYGMFPAFKKYAHPSGRKRLAGESAGDDAGALERHYAYAFEEHAPVIVRSLADSERIARKTRLYPAQNRLVIRGTLHSVTTQFLKGMGVNVRSVSPVAPDGLQGKLLKGEHLTLGEINRDLKSSSDFTGHIYEGMKTYEAAGRAGLLRKKAKVRPWAR